VRGKEYFEFKAVTQNDKSLLYFAMTTSHWKIQLLVGGILV